MNFDKNKLRQLFKPNRALYLEKKIKEAQEILSLPDEEFDNEINDKIIILTKNERKQLKKI